MKNLKRLLTVGLILTMLLSLAACSTKDKNSGTSEATDVGATTDVDVTDETTESDLDATDETTESDLDATDETQESDLDATDETQESDLDATDTETSELVRRTFGDIVMPETVEEIPTAFEAISQNFTSDVTDEQKSDALTVFTLAVTSELQNDTKAAKLAWEAFDELNLIQK